MEVSFGQYLISFNGLRVMRRITSTFIISTLVLSTLAGCAVENRNSGTRGIGDVYMSDVKTHQDGSFYVEAEAAPLAGRKGGAAEVAAQRATDFCAQRNKKMVKIDQKADSHLLVNGVSRLTFNCQ
ncbi:hypothetical protein ACFIQG_20645 [Comamonas odontotermitis]|uniref:hypothetical protein n=1 Tax=Comamonas odontotermitis TaxID=379895 RepID=UPI0036735B44